MTAERHGTGPEPRSDAARSLIQDGPSDFERSEKSSTPFCEGGSATCETCVGSCGVEEFEQREAAHRRRVEAMRDGY